MKLTTLLALLVWLFSANVSAQPFEPTDDELQHNASALELAAAGDFAAAVVEQQKAVDVRGLNVFWLNLGRFQQRAGQCAEAVASYTKAMTAPATVDPPPDVVRETAQRYVTELADECPARVRLSCVPADMNVVATSENSAEPVSLTCGQESPMGGGTWRFLGSYGAEQVERVEELRIAREYDVRLVISRPVAVNPPTEQLPGPSNIDVASPPPRSSPAVPALFVTAGAVVLLSGLLVDLLPASAHNGQLDGLDFVPLGLYIGGLTLIVVGFLQ